VDLLLVSQPTRTFKGRLARDKIAGAAGPGREDLGQSEPVVLASVRIDGPGSPRPSASHGSCSSPARKCTPRSAAATAPWLLIVLRPLGILVRKKLSSCSRHGPRRRPRPGRLRALPAGFRPRARRRPEPPPTGDDGMPRSGSPRPQRRAGGRRASKGRLRDRWPSAGRGCDVRRFALVLVLAPGVFLAAGSLGLFGFLKRTCRGRRVRNPGRLRPSRARPAPGRQRRRQPGRDASPRPPATAVARPQAAGPVKPARCRGRAPGPPCGPSRAWRPRRPCNHEGPGELPGVPALALPGGSRRRGRASRRRPVGGTQPCPSGRRSARAGSRSSYRLPVVVVDKQEVAANGRCCGARSHGGQTRRAVPPERSVTLRVGRNKTVPAVEGRRHG